jgi:hypothetical protein
MKCYRFLTIVFFLVVRLASSGFVLFRILYRYSVRVTRLFSYEEKDLPFIFLGIKTVS